MSLFPSKSDDLKFYAEHYSDIKALHVLAKGAQKRLPSLVDQWLKRELRLTIERNLKGFRFVDEDEGESSWRDKLFNSSREIGPKFGYEFNCNIEALDPDDDENDAWLYFWVEAGSLGREKKSAYLNAWRVVADSWRSDLPAKKYTLASDIDSKDPGYLCTYSLKSLITFERIVDPESCGKELRQTAVNFTKTILECVSKNKVPRIPE